MTTFSIASSAPELQEHSFWDRVRRAERQQWLLWVSAIVVTLVLTAGMTSFAYLFKRPDPQFSFTVRDSIRGLVALVFLFDVYTIYMQVNIHRIRRQLSENEAIFHLITENAEDLISVLDRDGMRLYASPGYTRLFGYSAADLQGTSIANQVHPEDCASILTDWLENLQKGVGARTEYRFRRSDGEWRILESTGSPVRNYHGEIERFVVVSRDITERKKSDELLRQREEQLRQAQKMEAVGRLSGGIAHDFNNLLGVIIGYSESMELRLSPDDPLRKSTEEIRKAGGRAAALTRQLLAFSRQQVLQPKVLDLNAVVTDMGKMLRRLIGADIEFTTRLASQLGHVKADQSQLEQVIVNLVVNARDAMPRGGKLLVETSNIELDENLARSLPFLHSGAHVLLTVTDTGIGMDEDTLRHIFEPFFTTKGLGKGTGLGLATVYGVVKQSGGVVGVDSQEGRGSTFKIFLPRAEESHVAFAPVVTGSVSVPQSGTILLVEDEDSLLTVTADTLTRNGYTVLSARDGVQALEIARSYNQNIDLLLSDVSMPRLGGPALAEYIVHLQPGIRVLFMTGHPERETDLGRKLPEGSDFLQKPFTQLALILHVRQMMSTAPPQLQD